jgi:hypothetical protein
MMLKIRLVENSGLGIERCELPPPATLPAAMSVLDIAAAHHLCDTAAREWS